MRLSCVFVFFGCKATETGRKMRLFFYPRLTRADTLSGGKKLALDIVIVLGGRSAHRPPLPRQLEFYSPESPTEFFGSGNCA